jgi:hypothetical protein
MENKNSGSSGVKKIAIFLVAILAIASLMLAGCGTPKPPVKSAQDLDKLLQNGQSVQQVYSLMTDSLKNTSTLYQAHTAEQSSDGSWVISAREGGYSASETDTYQVLFFHAEKSGDEALVVFFKSNSEFNKSWFTAQNATLVESTLKGIKAQ